ncbi:hypothetical protein CALCODRAFT_225680 [Calocera cornea HHB12733]|uniref:Uncharacterized protein n=1 Tax=Calocera cornea HHB12733 TaxID=1353952 RepID=A0A165C0Y5_9BASI|nr:hypothetical protein CALCODRAFT_225680 [Calocera cornea HHB12733]
MFPKPDALEALQSLYPADSHIGQANFAGVLKGLMLIGPSALVYDESLQSIYGGMSWPAVFDCYNRGGLREKFRLQCHRNPALLRCFIMLAECVAAFCVTPALSSSHGLDPVYRKVRVETIMRTITIPLKSILRWMRRSENPTAPEAMPWRRFADLRGHPHAVERLLEAVNSRLLEPWKIEKGACEAACLTCVHQASLVAGNLLTPTLQKHWNSSRKKQADLLKIHLGSRLPLQEVLEAWETSDGTDESETMVFRLLARLWSPISGLGSGDRNPPDFDLTLPSSKLREGLARVTRLPSEHWKIFEMRLNGRTDPYSLPVCRSNEVR